MKNAMMAVLVCLVSSGGPLACAPSPRPAVATGIKVGLPLGYARKFDAPLARTFWATVAGLERCGNTVVLADPERGEIRTAPGVNRLARLPSSAADNWIPLSHAFVVSVREQGPGVSLVTGYVRTFSSEQETTSGGKPNEPFVQAMWSRLFAEVASNLTQ